MTTKLKELKPGKEMDGAVIKRLHQILKNADLEKTTVKNIQKQLEVDLEISLSDRKAFIREEVQKFLKSGVGKKITSYVCHTDFHGSHFCLTERARGPQHNTTHTRSIRFNNRFGDEFLAKR